MRHTLKRWLLAPLPLVACADGEGLPAPRGDLTWAQAVEYRCAAQNDGPGPSYLWVNARDAESGQRWSVVVESHVISGAADHDPDADFVDARIKLRPRYSHEQLRGAREHLARFTDAEIRSQLRLKDPEDGSVRSFMRNWETQEAFAHALFERGFYPSRGDLTPELYVSPSPCEERQLSLHWIIGDWRRCIDELQSEGNHP